MKKGKRAEKGKDSVSLGTESWDKEKKALLHRRNEEIREIALLSWQNSHMYFKITVYQTSVTDTTSFYLPPLHLCSFILTWFSFVTHLLLFLSIQLEIFFSRLLSKTPFLDYSPFMWLLCSSYVLIHELFGAVTQLFINICSVSLNRWFSSSVARILLASDVTWWVLYT